MKLVNKIALAVVGYTTVGVIAQGNRNNREIARLYNSNNELQDELRSIKNEKFNLQHQVNMANMSIKHLNTMQEHDRNEQKELRKRVHDLEMDNITTKSQIKRAAEREDRTVPSYHTDRKEEKEAAKKAAEQEVAVEETSNTQALNELQEELHELLG